MAAYSWQKIFGTSGSDWLTGSDVLRDYIYAGGRDDYVLGYGGNDYLYGEAGRDYLFGGSGHDVLDGGIGDDRLYGGSGNDTLYGGRGADYLHGGRGTDHVSYEFSLAGAVDIDLLSNTGSGGDAAGDTLIDIENVTGTLVGDELRGNDADNVLTGLSGEDDLLGRGGNDTLYGGAQKDYLSGGTGNDTLYGGDGNDSIDDGEGDDIVYGGAGDDEFTAGAGADAYYGGADFFGTEYDALEYHYSEAGVTVDLMSGTGSGGFAEGDTYSSIEKVIGSIFDDTLLGDAGNNTLQGSGGEDVIVGGAGNDFMVGDVHSGDGAFSGYGTSDTFVFADTKGPEADVINDFEAGFDKIDLTATEFSDFNDLLTPGDRYWEQDGADTVIHYYEHTITLRNVDLADLSADDFLFA